MKYYIEERVRPRARASSLNWIQYVLVNQKSLTNIDDHLRIWFKLNGKIIFKNYLVNIHNICKRNQYSFFTQIEIPRLYEHFDDSKHAFINLTCLWYFIWFAGRICLSPIVTQTYFWELAEELYTYEASDLRAGHRARADGRPHNFRGFYFVHSIYGVIRPTADDLDNTECVE